MIKCRTALLFSTGLAAMLVGAPAQAAQEVAAEAQANAASTTQEEGEGQTIVVTAQKREERILDIPQSVTVVGGETLERENATTFEQ